MQRNLTRIQRDELIKRNSGGNVYAPKPVAAAGVGGGRTMDKKASLANYGYGERDDMIGFIRQGKQMKFDEIPSVQGEAGGGYESVPVQRREGNVGKWEVTQIISKPKLDDEEDGTPEVKEEENEDQGVGLQEDTSLGETRGTQKRERKRTPDAEDLLRFKVEEKTFPTEVKEEGTEIKVPNVGFKKRKIGMKNSRVSGAL